MDCCRVKFRLFSLLVLEFAELPRNDLSVSQCVYSHTAGFVAVLLCILMNDFVINMSTFY